MPSMQRYYFLLAVLAAVAAASAASQSQSPTSKSAKKQRYNSMKSRDELFDSKSDKSTISLREQKTLEGHRDMHDFRLLSGGMSDNRAMLSDYTVSIQVFPPTVLPLMDDHSKNIFELVALEFIVSNIDDQNLLIESISNIQITDQDLAWSSILDDLRTPGIEVFFRAEVVVSGRTSQEEVEQSIQFMFDSKSMIFREMFDIAKEYPIDGSSVSSPASSVGLPGPSIQPTVSSAGLSKPSTPPPSTLLPGPSTVSPASQALSVGPPDPSTGPSTSAQPLAPSTTPDPSTKISSPLLGVLRTGSTFLTVVIISTVSGSASFVVILLLLSRYIRKARDSNGEKPPLETTMQTEDKEDNYRSETSFILEDDDRGFIVSDEEGESVDPNYIDASTLANDYIDRHMYFECDESAIKSSIASSSSSNSGSTDSYNHSQKSVITLEDLDNFDKELRQSEC